MSQFAVRPLLETPTVTVRDVSCRGSARPAGPEERAAETQLHDGRGSRRPDGT